MQENLKEIEKSLLENDKSFGLLTIMGYYDAETDTDVDEYMLCTAVIAKKQTGFNILVGADLWITKDKEIKISVEDLIDVFDLFKKHKKELICDLHEDVNIFNIEKYIDRIRLLDCNKGNI